MDRPEVRDVDVRHYQKLLKTFICPVTISVAVIIICTIIGLFAFVIITASSDGGKIADRSTSHTTDQNINVLYYSTSVYNTYDPNIDDIYFNTPILGPKNTSGPNINSEKSTTNMVIPSTATSENVPLPLLSCRVF